MKILVAGIGMVGSNVVRILECREARPRSQSGTREKVHTADLKHGVDLRDRKDALHCVRGCEQVYHLADRTVGIGYSSTHHGQMMTDSLLISLNLLEAAHKVGVKNYLYVSSSCVYSDDWAIPTTEHMAACGIPEESNWGYGLAKRIAEQQCYFYAKEYGMRTVIARPANVYGPSYDWKRPPEEMHVIPSLIVKMLRGDKKITVWGTGNQSRTFQYEADTAALIVELMSKGKAGEAYNLGGTEASVAGLIEMLGPITQWRGEVEFDESKPEGPMRKAQDTQKLAATIVRSSEVSLEDGLILTVEGARKALQFSAA